MAPVQSLSVRDVRELFSANTAARFGPFLLVGVLGLMSCSSADELAQAAAPSTTAVSTTTIDEATVPDSAGPDPEPEVIPEPEPDESWRAVDLGADKLIFFGAVPPMPDGADLPLPDGSADYMDLFAPDSAWTEASEKIGAFKLHAWQVRHFLSEDELRTILDWLDEHQIPLMFETEPLPPPDPEECDHTESFEGPYDIEMANRIRRLGGTIAVVAIEEPYHFAHKLTGPGACEYPVERVVDEVIGYVNQIRVLFPDVPVGTIEPIWQSPRTEPEDMAIWLDTYEERSGEPFAFLHVDPEWGRPDWAEVALGIEAIADERDVPFGVLYNGGGENENDAWLAAAIDRIAYFEGVHGGTPQHVGLQSWMDQPDRVLPEDDLGAFTSLINRYDGSPSAISIDTESAGAAAVRLVDGAGRSLADQPVEVSLEPLDGALGLHSASGTVPAAAATAVIAIRVHTEDAANGVTDARLGRVEYRDGDDDSNRVSNPDFGRGLDGWGVYGEPRGRVSLEGSPAVMRLVADESQIILIDTAPFPVTAGTSYDFSALLGVPEEGIGTATIAVVFLDDGNAEVARQSIAFRPVAAEGSVITTDSSGSAVVSTSDLDAGRYLLTVRYPGDFDNWPSTTSISIDVPAAG